jgi:hypothetical protein
MMIVTDNHKLSKSTNHSASCISGRHATVQIRHARHAIVAISIYLNLPSIVIKYDKTHMATPSKQQITASQTTNHQKHKPQCIMHLSTTCNKANQARIYGVVVMSITLNLQSIVSKYDQTHSNNNKSSTYSQQKQHKPSKSTNHTAYAPPYETQQKESHFPSPHIQTPLYEITYLHNFMQCTFLLLITYQSIVS